MNWEVGFKFKSVSCSSPHTLYLYVFVCLCMCVYMCACSYLPWPACSGWRTTFRGWFSLSTLILRQRLFLFLLSCVPQSRWPMSFGLLLLSPPSACWDYRYVQSHLTFYMDHRDLVQVAKLAWYILLPAEPFPWLFVNFLLKLRHTHKAFFSGAQWPPSWCSHLVQSHFFSLHETQ